LGRGKSHKGRKGEGPWRNLLKKGGHTGIQRKGDRQKNLFNGRERPSSEKKRKFREKKYHKTQKKSSRGASSSMACPLQGAVVKKRKKKLSGPFDKGRRDGGRVSICQKKEESIGRDHLRRNPFFSLKQTKEEITGKELI